MNITTETGKSFAKELERVRHMTHGLSQRMAEHVDTLNTDEDCKQYDGYEQECIEMEALVRTASDLLYLHEHM